MIIATQSRFPLPLVLASVVFSLVASCTRHDAGGREAKEAPRPEAKAPPASPSPALRATPVASGATRGYVGSLSCKRCHEPEYHYWLTTPHSYMAKTAETERLVASSPLHRKDLPFPAEKVALVLGNLKKQVYLTRAGEEYRFLPQQWNLAAERWEAFDRNEWEPPLDGGGARDDVTWNEACAGCHTTGYDAATRGFVELSIGCEECHGPGERHASTKRKDDITNPMSLPPHLANAVCAQCHARGKVIGGPGAYPAEFTPGQDISKLFSPASAEYGKNTTLFWGNGMAAKHHQQFQEFAQSRHHVLGLTCLACHKGHRIKLAKPPEISRSVAMTTERHFLAARAYSVCVDCHTRPQGASPGEPRTTLFDDPDAHSHHPAMVKRPLRPSDPTGGTRVSKMLCNDCHMPPTAPRQVGFEMHTHTFRVPGGTATKRFGVPNGCSWCHADKDADWVTQQIRKLWLDDALIASHCERFVRELQALVREHEDLVAFLSGAPESKLPRVRPLLARRSPMERVAEDARKVVSKTTLDPEARFDIHDEVRTAEPELYRLTAESRRERQLIEDELRALIDMDALRGLNRLREKTGLAPAAAPDIAATYAGTESAYRSHNDQVRLEGEAFFKSRGLKTTWNEWLRICAALASGDASKQPAVNLEELADLGLIQYQVELK